MHRAILSRKLIQVGVLGGGRNAGPEAEQGWGAWGGGVAMQSRRLSTALVLGVGAVVRDGPMIRRRASNRCSHRRRNPARCGLDPTPRIPANARNKRQTVCGVGGSTRPHTSKKRVHTVHDQWRSGSVEAPRQGRHADRRTEAFAYNTGKHIDDARSAQILGLGYLTVRSRPPVICRDVR